MTRTIFWLAFGWVVYVYAGYPLLLVIWKRFRSRPVHKAAFQPTVSLVIAMHNESENVDAKMSNCSEFDYPAGKMEIIVSLDAPTDGTDVMMEKYRGARVIVLSSGIRRGKATALNNALAVASGDIVVFTDARQRFERTAIRELMGNFADESVGAVSGQLILLDAENREAGDAVGLYWRYEKALRAMESQIHSVPGTTGAIYAIRRELFAPLPPKTVLDDVLVPMKIVVGGKRALFEPAAVAYDTVSESPKIEYERKRRTLMGNYELLASMPDLLIPWRNPIFVQLVSHKVGRLFVPYCLAALLLTNLFLRHGYYSVFLVCQGVFYLCACAGWVLSVARDARTSVGVKRLERAEKSI
jgi:poly-beta-1,6-N-acetyl-D-glucosamine synthase